MVASRFPLMILILPHVPFYIDGEIPTCRESKSHPTIGNVHFPSHESGQVVSTCVYAGPCALGLQEVGNFTQLVTVTCTNDVNDADSLPFLFPTSISVTQLIGKLAKPQRFQVSLEVQCPVLHLFFLPSVLVG